jgi:hypothetical protein
MRLRLCVRAAVTAGIALAGYMATPTISLGIVGMSSAEAAQFYTRKRVNGVWVTGRFPKGATSARTVRSTRVASPARTKAPPPAAEKATVVALLPPPVLRREPGNTDTTGSTAARADLVRPPVLPDFEAALVIAAVGPVAPVDEDALASQERAIKLRRALEVRAGELAAKSGAPIAAAETTARPAPPPVSSRELPRAAEPTAASLVQPASGSLAPTTNSLSSPRPAASGATAGGLVPRSVSYDFENGIKTTVYENSVVREPFDVWAMRGLNAPR